MVRIEDGGVIYENDRFSSNIDEIPAEVKKPLLNWFAFACCPDSGRDRGAALSIMMLRDVMHKFNQDLIKETERLNQQNHFYKYFSQTAMYTNRKKI